MQVLKYYFFSNFGSILGTINPLNKRYVPFTMESFMPRIYLNTVLLKFIRQGRTEGVKYPQIYKQIFIEQPYWFHVTLKSDKDLFYRSERTNWRELGNFIDYPYLKDYIDKYVLKYKYKCSEKEAINRYISTNVLPLLVQYDAKKYYQYPLKLKHRIKEEENYK